MKIRNVIIMYNLIALPKGDNNSLLMYYIKWYLRNFFVAV